MAIAEQLLTGPAAAGSLAGIAELRIAVFREFPYLYAGRRKDELRYLRIYAEKPDAFVITVTDAGTLAGAATGIPLRHAGRQLTEPFAGSAYAPEEIYYVGELLFSPLFRNRGLGLKLLERIEQHISSFGQYRYLTCATVVRTDSHPLRPVDYVPIDRFLTRSGFVPLPGVTTDFAWRETDGVNRDHTMQFFVKELA